MPRLDGLGEYVEIPALEEKEWKAFHLEQIGTITSGRDIYAAERIDGYTPYITSGGTNNGVGYFVGNDNDTLDAGYIALNRNGAVGKAFYHQEKSLMGNDCRKIHLKEADGNLFVGQFVALCISMQSECFSYSRKLGTARAKQMLIMLPVTDAGEPDYEYMEKYARQKFEAMLSKYRAYVEARIAKLGEPIVLPTLEEKEWREFHIGELFEVSRPTARNKDAYQTGDIPFVASGSVNNGVTKLCKPFEEEQLDDGCCITVSPVDGSTFFQPMNFLGRGGAGSSILMLRCSNLNLYCGQFIARAIQQTCSKYTYGHMGNKDSIKRERIMLPVADSGEPDYEYMEQYAKNMMLRKYHQYLAFLRSR